jgi:hypothetical protein
MIVIDLYLFYLPWSRPQKCSQGNECRHKQISGSGLQIQGQKQLLIFEL